MRADASGEPVTTFENSGDFRFSTNFQGSTIGQIFNFTTEGRQADAALFEHALGEAEAKFNDMPTNALPDREAPPAAFFCRFPSAQTFVGRDADFLALARLLKGGNAAIGEAVAATGYGGIGKTQLAVEFAHRYGAFFQGGVFFVGFADPDAIDSEVAAWATTKEGELPGGVAGAVNNVKAYWANALPKLLIFDNCEDDALIAQWAPSSGGARVLATSRRQFWSAASNVTQHRIGLLNRAESIKLLRKFRPELAEDCPHLDAISEELGDLPLALHMAGAYLERYKEESFGDPARYLEALKAAPTLAHPSLTDENETPNATDHDRHVGRTFSVSIERLKDMGDAGADALDALARLSHFAPGEPITRSLLKLTYRDNYEADLTEAAEKRVADAIRNLLDVGLAEDDEGALVVHRLIVAYVQAPENPLGGDPHTSANAVDLAIMNEAITVNASGLPAPLLSWRVHLARVAEKAELAGRQSAAVLFNEFGYHLNRRERP